LDTLCIEGGIPLEGKTRVHGSKNAALPILAASILADGEHVIEEVPQLIDISVMLKILESLGVRAVHSGHIVQLDTRQLTTYKVPESLMGQMRSSIFLMGPLVARTGEAIIYRPGGCTIGTRGINLHLDGLRRLGVEIEQREGMIYCRAKRLTGAKIVLDYPSVGATENIMMAATRAKGITRIVNAAREPEIEDLQKFLNAMGARVHGAGSNEIVIEGVDTLHSAHHHVIPDRIVAGTLCTAAAITCGDVALCGVNPDHLEAVTEALTRCGVEIQYAKDVIRIIGRNRPKAIDKITTSPHPGFPTDMQPQLMAYLSIADGTSIITETVFDGRFRHVNELQRMGAQIHVDYHTAIIRGIPRLSGAKVKATDLRAGAALVLSGLAAEGRTVIDNVHQIDRGYEKIEQILTKLGARIRRETAN
jgi:UDP-N-acetylglucosamine 1-carboxyvinyltransferase